jgi:uncharacterized membrane protein
VKPTAKYLLLLFILLLPFVVLYFVWEQIPAQVPIHYNIKGEADNFIEKAKYPYTLLLPVIIFSFVMLILKVVSGSIDDEAEKRNIEQVAFKISILLALFFAVLMSYIVYNAAYSSELILGKIVGAGILLLVGFIFRFTKDIPQNAFIGVRTKWTLNNAEIWKRTHDFCASQLFYLFIAGAVIAVLLPELASFIFSFAWMIMLMAISIWYSYHLSKNLK